MSIPRRVYVSLPADPWLAPNINALKWGIVEQIEKLGYTPSVAGIFVLTRDHQVPDDATQQAMPRDNVLFETGYFVSAKGKRNVLIIREHGAKLPADLGGDIYASLVDRTDVAPIERSARAFMEAI